MELKLGLILLGLVLIMVGFILKEFVKLMKSNTHMLHPTYMNDENTVKGTSLEIHKDGHILIKPTKRFSHSWYI